jgi:hypothetical protein
MDGAGMFLMCDEVGSSVPVLQFEIRIGEINFVEVEPKAVYARKLSPASI